MYARRQAVAADSNAAALARWGSPRAFTLLRRGEAEELSSGRFEQAAKVYRKCVETSRHPAQQASARLRLARVLAKVGRTEQSLVEHEQVLAADAATVPE